MKQTAHTDKKPPRSLVNFVLIPLILICLMIAAFMFAKKNEDEGLKINLAGRQRMLTQMIMKDLLLRAYTQKDKNEILAAVNTFSMTLKALKSGGKAPLQISGQTFAKLSPPGNTAIKEKLAQASLLWREFNNAIMQYLNKSDKTSLEYLVANNNKLLSMVNDTVFLMQENYEANNLKIRIFIFLTVAIALATICINVFILIKRLKKAQKQIEALEKLLPICSNCKKIRTDDTNPKDIKSWETIEMYLKKKKDMEFTHSICPECIKKLYPEFNSNDKE